MADWHGTCRSNYFRVKDREAFQTMLDQYEAKLIINVENPDQVGFISEDWHGAIPTRIVDEDELTDCDMDQVSILDEIAEHLAENEVCIVMEVGSEKARYLTGFAIAISWTNERVKISLSDIYAQAQEEFGGDANITEAIY